MSSNTHASFMNPCVSIAPALSTSSVQRGNLASPDFCVLQNIDSYFKSLGQKSLVEQLTLQLLAGITLRSKVSDTEEELSNWFEALKLVYKQAKTGNPALYSSHAPARSQHLDLTEHHTKIKAFFYNIEPGSDIGDIDHAIRSKIEEQLFKNENWNIVLAENIEIEIKTLLKDIEIYTQKIQNIEVDALDLNKPNHCMQLKWQHSDLVSAMERIGLFLFISKFYTYSTEVMTSSIASVNKNRFSNHSTYGNASNKTAKNNTPQNIETILSEKIAHLYEKYNNFVKALQEKDEQWRKLEIQRGNREDRALSEQKENIQPRITSSPVLYGPLQMVSDIRDLARHTHKEEGPFGSVAAGSMQQSAQFAATLVANRLNSSATQSIGRADSSSSPSQKAPHTTAYRSDPIHSFDLSSTEAPIEIAHNLQRLIKRKNKRQNYIGMMRDFIKNIGARISRFFQLFATIFYKKKANSQLENDRTLPPKPPFYFKKPDIPLTSSSIAAPHVSQVNSKAITSHSGQSAILNIKVPHAFDKKSVVIGGMSASALSRASKNLARRNTAKYQKIPTSVPEKIADAKSTNSQHGDTLSRVINTKNNNQNTPNPNHSNITQTNLPIGLGLQYSADEESGTDSGNDVPINFVGEDPFIYTPPQINTSHFELSDEEDSSDNESQKKNESFSSYKKLTVGKSKKILLGTDVFKKSPPAKENNNTEHIHKNIDSAYESSSSYQFLIPNNTIKRTEFNLYSEIDTETENNKQKLSFSNKSPTLPPNNNYLTQSVSAIQEEASRSYSSITESEIDNTAESWINIDENSSMISGSVYSEPFLYIDANAVALASSMSNVGSEEDKHISNDQKKIVTASSQSSDSLQARIKELEAIIEQQKVEHVKFEEVKDAVLKGLEIENFALLEKENKAMYTVQEQTKLIDQSNNTMKLFKQTLNKNQAIIQELEALKTKHEAEIIGLNNQLEKKQIDDLDRIRNLEKSQEHIKNLVDTVNSTEENIKIEKAEKAELQTTVQNLSNRLEEKAALEIELENVREQARHISELKVDLEKKAALYMENHTLQQAKLEELDAENIAVLAEKNKQLSKINELTETLKNTKKQLGDVSNTNNRLQVKIAWLEREKDTVQQDLSDMDVAHNVSTNRPLSTKPHEIYLIVNPAQAVQSIAEDNGSTQKTEDEKSADMIARENKQAMALATFFSNLEQRSKDNSLELKNIEEALKDREIILESVRKFEEEMAKKEVQRAEDRRLREEYMKAMGIDSNYKFK